MKIISDKLASLKRIKLSKLRLILIVLGLFILLGTICFIYLQQRQQRSLKGVPGQPQGWGQKPDGAQDFGGPPETSKKPRWNGPIPDPPKDKITYYKGIWRATWIYPEERSQLKPEPEKYREWGVNIINISPGFEINKDGEVRYPLDFPSYEDMDARIGEITEMFYKEGIHLAMTIQIHYKEEFVRGAEWGGATAYVPKEKIQNPGYLENFDKIVVDMAKIAQKYHLEMFSPLGEPENVFYDAKLASDWNQQILPKVKKYYQGKIYYKGDLHKDEGDIINFKGYDVLGIMPHLAELAHNYQALREKVVSNMDKGLAWAKRDGVPEVVVAEHGYEAEGKMWPADNYNILLEESSNRLNGIFLSDPFPNVLETKQGEQIVSMTKKWFSPK